MKRNIFLLFVIVLFLSCKNNPEINFWRTEDGYVPDKATAIKIAEIVSLRIYGNEIKDELPFECFLNTHGVWVINGIKKSDNYFGGVVYIEIQKSDGKILKINHPR